MGVTLSAEMLGPFPRFSLFNSPYPAHTDGRAVDLYLDERRAAVAPSPVAGEVLATRTVACPDRPYAAEKDHLILVTTEGVATTGGSADLVARVLHVAPTVERGDRVAVGDPLGRTVRSGYFAPWVGDHLHLGFRPPDTDLRRARGSLPVAVDVPVEPLGWDGTGTVVATGDSYAVLDAPAHAGGGYAALASDGGLGLDGGLVHYEGGGVFAASGREADPETADGRGPVALLGRPVGDRDGRRVRWRDVAVRVDGEPVTGLSLAASRDGAGARLVGPDLGLRVGERVAVSIAPTTDPVRLG